MLPTIDSVPRLDIVTANVPSTHSPPAISVQNVGKMYRIYDRPQDRLKQMLWRGNRQFGHEFWALRNVSVEIQKGETIGIVGRNGSGKSTLLQIIAGTLAPTEGEVTVNGRVAALLELGSGFNPDFTGRENVFLNGSILGISREEMERRFDDIAAFADIGEFMEQPVKTYSSGMFARLAFAVAISVDADILIADEILSVGDMAFQAKCFRAFHKLRENGCTILFVSHDVYTVRSFCQRSLYLRHGEQIAWGASYAVIDRYITDMETNQADSNISVQETYNDEMLFRIDDVTLLDNKGQSTEQVRSGETIQIRFRYTSLVSYIQKVVFVVNLYKSDGLYIYGSTSLMDGLAPIPPGTSGLVTVTFPYVNLLSGNYYWRVAVDDEHGFGVYTALTNMCPFRVNDRLEAVGLVNLPREWDVEVTTI